MVETHSQKLNAIKFQTSASSLWRNFKRVTGKINFPSSPISQAFPRIMFIVPSIRYYFLPYENQTLGFGGKGFSSTWDLSHSKILRHSINDIFPHSGVLSFTLAVRSEVSWTCLVKHHELFEHENHLFAPSRHRSLNSILRVRTCKLKRIMCKIEWE